MRGFNQVIMLVIMVIIGSSLLFLGLKTIGMVGGGIKDIQNIGTSERQKFENMQSLASACEDWLYGDKYSADAILNTYRLPARMRPYVRVWSICGEELNNIAQNCYKETEVTRDCAGGGYLKADSYVIESCSNICVNVRKIYDKCSNACPDKGGICFEKIVDSLGSSIDDSDLQIRGSELERACS